MANSEHLKILQQGVAVWNKWREENPEVRPDLTGAFLAGIDLSDFNFSKSDLKGVRFDFNTILNGAVFYAADLESLTFGHELKGVVFTNDHLPDTTFYGSDLSDADFTGAGCGRANFRSAVLKGAKFYSTNLNQASFDSVDLEGAVFIESTLKRANLTNVNLTKARIEGCCIYGLSAWNLQKDGLIQKDLIITPSSEPEITVGDLEVAQFIYLMLNNRNIRNAIETITSKAVLILGRFTEDRKKVLDALKAELRLRNYLPIVFDFEPSANRDLTETISLLAKMSRFVVADLTDAKSIPQELSQIIPHTPSVAVLPIILKGQREYAMFEHFRRYPWVLPLHEYASPEELLTNIIPAIVAPAEQKVAELRGS